MAKTIKAVPYRAFTIYKINTDPKVCLCNMVILIESQNIGNKIDESSIRKGNVSKRKLPYNARSDTELCWKCVTVRTAVS